MLRKLRALTIAVCVIGTMGVGAASAQAANGTVVTSTGGAVSISGVQVGTHKFTLTDHKLGEGFATWTCKSATFEAVGTTANGASSFVLHPVYKECTAFGLAMTLTTTGCDFQKTITERTAVLVFVWVKHKHITCSGANKILLSTATCKLNIAGQNGISTSAVSNAGGAGASEMDLSLSEEEAGIKYEVTQDGIGCPLSGTGSFSKGDYTGTTTLTAKTEGGGAAGITLDD